ncbi:MAG TPA: pseudouridine synthase [Mobilitalea sp.]|nr:pseudouridine synthase [Mobilitalea sp.]
MRLDKFLAEASVGTRKIIRDYVKEGKVTVNNREIKEPAAEIDENKDVIRYLGKEIIHTGKAYYMFHKPGGCITATKDANNNTVLDYFDAKVSNGLFPVGRLDKDTEGLLLLTNDGEFSHRLMHPNKHVEKTYFFWAFGSLDSGAKEHLINGINIGKDEALAKAIKVEVEEEGQYRELKDRIDHEKIKDIRKNPYQQQVISGYLTISEGRKHQVKRMLKAVGCYVVYLKRVSIGGLMLDESLKEGQYRELTEEEINILF